MFFRSPVLLFDKSKRLAVKLVSSVGTGFSYWTEKSPLKKEIRMALRKYDPMVNRHVMFYEAALSKPRRGKMRRPLAWARWTGRGIEELVKRVARKHDRYGFF
ncbi:mrpl33 [Symbiodinium sp. CCMP2592]|nr:mrpl33 [Symbiodinium sp. CCMP2592]